MEEDPPPPATRTGYRGWPDRWLARSLRYVSIYYDESDMCMSRLEATRVEMRCRNDAGPLPGRFRVGSGWVPDVWLSVRRKSFRHAGSPGSVRSPGRSNHLLEAAYRD